jgi:hypothetical protein
MATVTLSKVLVNPRRKRNRRKARRRNPQLALVGNLNPRKRRNMARKRKNNPRRVRVVHRRRNPIILLRRRHRRRNPDMGAPVRLLKTGTLALIGLVATRQVPQMLLGSRNTGIVGYIANAATALASAALARRMAGHDAAEAVGIGGAMYLANRIISEQLTPVGKVLSLQGIGDAQAAGLGNVGKYVSAYWTHPVVEDRSGKPVIPDAIREAAREEAMSVLSQQRPTPPPAAQVAGLRLR